MAKNTDAETQLVPELNKLDDFISSIEGEPEFLPERLSLEERIKYEKQKNETTLINTILNVWEDQQNAERTLRKEYASCFIWVLALQLVVINVIFVLIGCNILKYEQWTANLFIVSVFGEIVGIVSIIVKYLFTSTNKEMIDLIKEQK